MVSKTYSHKQEYRQIVETLLRFYALNEGMPYEEAVNECLGKPKGSSGITVNSLYSKIATAAAWHLDQTEAQKAHLTTKGGDHESI